jgi:hypothetical protein
MSKKIPKPSSPAELLVLSGRGIHIGRVGHYGTFEETSTFEEAVKIARVKRADKQVRAFVAIRIEAAVIDGISPGIGTQTELARFEVYPDRVVLVPTGQGGLSNEQRDKVHLLPKKSLL